MRAWDRGQEAPHYERALLMLGLAAPAATGEDPAAWTIGRRDARLLDLRESLFGEQLISVVNCPRCGARLELNITTAQLRAPVAEHDRVEFNFSLPDGDYHGRLRLPNSLDLRAMATAPSREELLRRCLCELRRGDAPVMEEPLSPAILDALARRIEAADPQAVVELALTCVECGHEWVSVFDIVTFLWDEIRGWAETTLREVHLLASAYGWSEGEILSMNPRRRQRYLELILE